MFDRNMQQAVHSRRHRHPSVLAACATGVVGVLIASFAAMALAAHSAAPTVGSATNAKFEEKITIDAHGRTLYALNPETTQHLLCKTNECLKFWPPLTVRSRKTKLTAAPGVRGHLGILRRSNGMLQVTLRGLPLYHFSGDSASGTTGGENIKSFGGTWHVISAPSTAIPAPTTGETTPSSPVSPTTPIYPPTPTTSTPAYPPTPTTTTPTTTAPTETTPTTTTPYYPPY